MARADLLVQLVKAANAGDQRGVRQVTEALAAEERAKRRVIEFSFSASERWGPSTTQTRCATGPRYLRNHSHELRDSTCSGTI
jgi:hypothetical protein